MIPTPPVAAVPPASPLLAEAPPPPSPPSARAVPSPSILPPARPRVAKAPVGPATKGESAGEPRDGKGARTQGPSPSLSSERGGKGSAPRAGSAEPEGARGARPEADRAEGPTRPFDLRGQVAMLWKSLDPTKYPHQEADTGEDGDTGSPTERTISLDSQDSRYASYLLGVKRRIESRWGYPEGARGLTGDLLVTFAITRDGRLTDLNLTETSGIAPLDNEAIRAIREAAPFAPFPERMKFERLKIRAAFYYYNTRARVRGE
ncbi:MAG: TonB family protein [candidate division NC10 bacterium]|nr:TonB family protein [candidate division NC10 bacterium]